MTLVGQAKPPAEKLDTELDPSSEVYRILFDPSPEYGQAWIESMLTIDNERGQFVPFRLFPQQKRMLEEQTGRDITVKGRQTRASSLILARNLRRMTTGFGVRCLVMTNSDQVTMIFRSRIEHHLRDLKARGLDYPIVLNNKDELVIGDQMRNHYIFASGEQRVAGRAYAAHIVHLCMAEGTMVRTEDGFLEPITSVSGQAWTHAGRRARITSRTFSGRKPMVKVSLPGEDILCTPDHRFWTEDGWANAEDLTGKYVGIPRRRISQPKKPYWEMSLGREAKKLQPRIDLDEDFGFVVGCFLAEGNLFRAGIQFSLNAQESGTAKRLADRLRPHSQSIRMDWRPKRPHNLNVIVYSTDLRRLFEEKLYRRGDKAFPDTMFRSPRPFLRGVIRGYVEGDGNPFTARDQISIPSVRPQTVTQLQDLISALHGWWGPIYKSSRERYGKPTQDIWNLVYQGKANQAFRKGYGWPLPERLRNVRHRTHKGRVLRAGEPCLYRWIRVGKVEPAGEHDAYDISLDHPDHSFRTLVASVHNSEVAHWKPENAAQLMGGITPAVPGPPKGWFDMESTPNGAEGIFYEYCQDALVEDPLQAWKLHFYPWWLEPRYRAGNDDACDLHLDLETLNELIRSFHPSPREEWLLSEHGLNVEQMLWRRYRERELAKTGVPFTQEYVESLDDCFITGEDNFFASPDGQDHLAWYRDHCSDPVVRLDSLPYRDARISFFGHNLSIWELPDPNSHYVGYLDLAEGGQTRDHDYSALTIQNVYTRHHVATLRLRCSPGDFAAMACAVGQYYNWAVIGGERGGYGSAALSRIQELSYKRIYYHYEPNKRPEPWIYPTSANRDDMLRVYREDVFEHSFHTRDRLLVSEMGSFDWAKVSSAGSNARVYKAKARRRKNDDMVMSMAGANYVCHRYLRQQKPPTERAPDEMVTVGEHGVVVARGQPAAKPWFR